VAVQTRSRPLIGWDLRHSELHSEAGDRKSRLRSRRDACLCVPGCLRAADLVSVVALGFVAARLKEGHVGRIPGVDWLEIVLGGVLAVNYFALSGSYGAATMRRVGGQVTRAIAGWVLVMASLLALRYVETGNNLIPSWMLAWFLTTLPVLLVLRVAIGIMIEGWYRRGQLTSLIAVVGSGFQSCELARRAFDNRDVDIVGIFDAEQWPDTGRGIIDEFYQLANRKRLDEIVIALPLQSPAELDGIIHKLSVLPVDFKLYAGAPAVVLRNMQSATDAPTFLIQRRPLAGWNASLKRAEDIILAGTFLIALAPLFLLIAAIIKIDSPGPVLFQQDRFAFPNNNLRIYKFRTMHYDRHPNPLVPQAKRNDPRVTRFGGFLRRSSLDELPQLFNVLVGTMSFVGPRPHATAHNKKYGRLIDGYLGRHRMKPGITGWAQVHGHRGETDTIDKMRHRVEHDLYYIENWSLMLDLKIILKTVPLVIRGHNAY
jgi:Undecaprenyl-phosphate glucose phosphotransferase